MRINAANIVFIGLLSVCLAGCLSSCRKEDPVLRGEGDHVGGDDSGEIKGFFLLNEGTTRETSILSVIPVWLLS